MITYLAVLGLALLTVVFVAATVLIVVGVVRTIHDAEKDTNA
jgi:hypothetical protein